MDIEIFGFGLEGIITTIVGLIMGAIMWLAANANRVASKKKRK